MGDPNPETGIFGCGDCGHSHRGHAYKNVILLVFGQLKILFGQTRDVNHREESWSLN